MSVQEVIARVRAAPDRPERRRRGAAAASGGVRHRARAAAQRRRAHRRPGLWGGGSAAQQMVALAQREIGVKERRPAPTTSRASPTTARPPPARASAPWCAYFTSWLAKSSGAPLGEAGQGFGSVDALYAWAQRTGKAIQNGPGVSPQPGDLIVWDEHIGLVESVDPDGTVHTIEGNKQRPGDPPDSMLLAPRSGTCASAEPSPARPASIALARTFRKVRLITAPAVRRVARCRFVGVHTPSVEPVVSPRTVPARGAAGAPLLEKGRSPMSTDRTWRAQLAVPCSPAGFGMIAAPTTPATATSAPAAPSSCQAQASTLSLLGAEPASANQRGRRAVHHRVAQHRPERARRPSRRPPSRPRRTPTGHPCRRGEPRRRAAGRTGGLRRCAVRLASPRATRTSPAARRRAPHPSRRAGQPSKRSSRPSAPSGCRDGHGATSIAEQARLGLPAALPTVLPELLSADVLSATATATLRGRPTGPRSGATVTGLRVLGTTIDANEAADRVLSIDTAGLTLGQLVSSEQTAALDHRAGRAAVAAGAGHRQRAALALRPARRPRRACWAPSRACSVEPHGGEPRRRDRRRAEAGARTSIPLPNRPAPRADHAAHVGDRSRDGHRSASALTISISALDEPLLEGTLASVRVGAAAAGCSAPPASRPTPTPGPVATRRRRPPRRRPNSVSPSFPMQPAYARCRPAAAAVRRCPAAPHRRASVGHTMLVRGVAKRDFVGRPVAIKQFKSGRLVGRTKVRGNGTFAMRLPLPPAEIRDTNRAATTPRRSVAGATRQVHAPHDDRGPHRAGRDGDLLGPDAAALAEGQTTVVIRRRRDLQEVRDGRRVKADATGRFSGSFKRRRRRATRSTARRRACRRGRARRRPTRPTPCRGSPGCGSRTAAAVSPTRRQQARLGVGPGWLHAHVASPAPQGHPGPRGSGRGLGGTTMAAGAIPWTLLSCPPPPTPRAADRAAREAALALRAGAPPSPAHRRERRAPGIDHAQCRRAERGGRLARLAGKVAWIHDGLLKVDDPYDEAGPTTITTVPKAEDPLNAQAPTSRSPGRRTARRSRSPRRSTTASSRTTPPCSSPTSRRAAPRGRPSRSRR